MLFAVGNVWSLSAPVGALLWSPEANLCILATICILWYEVQTLNTWFYAAERKPFYFMNLYCVGCDTISVVDSHCWRSHKLRDGHVLMLIQYTYILLLAEANASDFGVGMIDDEMALIFFDCF